MKTAKPPQSELPPPVIYHYTSVNALFNIMQSRSIWLSPTHLTNDGAEVISTINYAQKHVKNLIKNTDEPDLQTLLENLDKGLTGLSHPAYIFSLSADGDSLSQWRGYADDARGVAIGFNSAWFPRKEDTYPQFTKTTDPYNSLRLFYMNYGKEQNTAVEGVLEATLEVYPRLSEENLLEIILVLSHKFKNPSFQEEEEWRLNFLPDPSLYDLQNKELCELDYKKKIADKKIWLSELRYRTNGKTLIPYFELPLFPNENITPIAEIVLGPKCKINPQDLTRFSCYCGFCQAGEEENFVKISKSTYR